MNELGLLVEINEKLTDIESLLQRLPEIQAAVFIQMQEEVKKNGRKCKRTARKTDDYAFRAVKECEKCCGFVSIDTRDG